MTSRVMSALRPDKIKFFAQVWKLDSHSIAESKLLSFGNLHFRGFGKDILQSLLMQCSSPSVDTCHRFKGIEEARVRIKFGESNS